MLLFSYGSCCCCHEMRGINYSLDFDLGSVCDTNDPSSTAIRHTQHTKHPAIVLERAWLFSLFRIGVWLRRACSFSLVGLSRSANYTTDVSHSRRCLHFFFFQYPRTAQSRQIQSVSFFMQNACLLVSFALLFVSFRSCLECDWPGHERGGCHASTRSCKGRVRVLPVRGRQLRGRWLRKAYHLQVGFYAAVWGGCSGAVDGHERWPRSAATTRYRRDSRIAPCASLCQGLKKFRVRRT